MNKQQKCGIIFIDHTKDPTYPLYLIVYSHKSRKYGFPKGTRETGESLTTCARREFYEETGYMLKDHILLYDSIQNKKQYLFHIKLL